MIEIIVNTDTDSLPEGLSISDERFKELDYQLKLIMHELHRPLREGEEQKKGMEMIADILKLAKTEHEIAFVMFVSGRALERFDIFEQ
jgi:hypothetical protein